MAIAKKRYYGGKMKRTWRDAACEVALNKIHKEWSREYSYFHIDAFLREKPSFVWGSAFCEQLQSIETRPYLTIDAFRAAFFKWLDENEVKK